MNTDKYKYSSPARDYPANWPSLLATNTVFTNTNTKKKITIQYRYTDIQRQNCLILGLYNILNDRAPLNKSRNKSCCLVRNDNCFPRHRDNRDIFNQFLVRKKES